MRNKQNGMPIFNEKAMEEIAEVYRRTRAKYYLNTDQRGWVESITLKKNHSVDFIEKPGAQKETVHFRIMMEAGLVGSLIPGTQVRERLANIAVVVKEENQTAILKKRFSEFGGSGFETQMKQILENSGHSPMGALVNSLAVITRQLARQLSFPEAHSPEAYLGFKVAEEALGVALDQLKR
ncbi:MAG: hypothetical protein KGH61_01115 [Candidatus Micrarchaeota archaeon]|nr:hypothetical protein [Candidatus Micrarchaeota archaeon]MDE1847533.1 hypothetical protein [Candidatus Micrarchaeota archaeon]MDE1864250.1 hypothetical protein [Candidatus Micrarchaeota archaeon]